MEMIIAVFVVIVFFFVLVLLSHTYHSVVFLLSLTYHSVVFLLYSVVQFVSSWEGWIIFTISAFGLYEFGLDNLREILITLGFWKVVLILVGCIVISIFILGMVLKLFKIKIEDDSKEELLMWRIFGNLVIVPSLFIFFFTAYIHMEDSPSNSTYNQDTVDYYEYDSGDSNNNPGVHHVDPHWVDGYQRSDGAHVEGYWRGGDSGYDRSNPDGNPFNNLK